MKNEIQASDRAIDAYLKKLHAVNVDGSYISIDDLLQVSIHSIGRLRLLDFDFRTKLIEYIFSLISIHDWTKESIPLDKCAYEMKEMCPKSVSKDNRDCSLTLLCILFRNVAKQFLEQLGTVSADGRY